MKAKTSVVLLCSLVGLLITGCVGPNLLPIAGFTLTPETGLSPLNVILNASESVSPNGIISQYSWDFGDGTTGSGMIVTHSYLTDKDRTFIITLHITDNEGNTASSTENIFVQAPIPSADEGPSIAFVWPFHFDAEGDDAANLNDEYFTLQNTGDEAIDLSGWRVENDRGTAFWFPSSIMLAPGATLTIHSGYGIDTATHLYWRSSEPIWDNNSDLAFLINAAGEIVLHYSIQSC